MPTLTSTAIASAAGPAPSKVDRLLILSLPAVSWPDLQAADLPHLRRLLDQSAVANMVTRTGGSRNSVGAGYLTLGAGSRAEGDDFLAGQAFDADERFGTLRAADVFAQRTGRQVTGGLLNLSVEALTTQNAEGRYSPRLGSLGDALDRAGIARAVIANADGPQPVVDGSLPTSGRAAVSALMDHDGVVPRGQVNDALLMRDPHVPFGVRLDPDAVVKEFTKVWLDRSVVLVEASDLQRAAFARALATSPQVARQLKGALERTDVLVGRILRHVGPHDSVLLVGPTGNNDGGLAVAALRSPGIKPGLLQSGTSRRTGIVYLTDVAPTVLDLFGIGRPAHMEGEVMEVRHTGGSAESRIDHLVNTDQEALFRDSLVTPASLIVVVLGSVLAAMTVLAVTRRRGGRAVEWAALAILGFLTATYIAELLNFRDRNATNEYWAFLVVTALAFAGVCRWAGRGDPYRPLLLALGAIVALHLGDLLAGARLELNTVFGYSATVGIRTSGEGNLTFAQLAAASVLLVGLVAWRAPSRKINSRRVTIGAIAFLLVTVLVMVAPPWGSDFGAALAAAPAFALLTWFLLGRRVQWRAVLLLSATLVGAALAVGFVDLLRPPDSRTHIGRFFSQVGRDGFAGFSKVVQRKLDANLASFSTARMEWLLPVVAALFLLLWLLPGLRLRSVVRESRLLRQTAIALAVLTVLGYALNDSGISIPALMALLTECVVVYVSMLLEFHPNVEPSVDTSVGP